MTRIMAFSFLATVAFSKGPVLTETVGTSAFQVVTSREVKASTFLNQALKSEMQDLLATSSANESNATLYEIAIFRESQSLGAVKLSAEELNRFVSQAQTRLQKNKDWKKLEVQDGELRQWVERKHVAETFLELKASSLTSIVTDQEIQEYYEKNRAKFGQTPLFEQKDNIRRFLQKESQKSRIQDWLTALKVKYQIRNDLMESSAKPETSKPGTDTSGDAANSATDTK